MVTYAGICSLLNQHHMAISRNVEDFAINKEENHMLEDLKSVRERRYAIESLMERIARLRSSAQRVTRQLSHTPRYTRERDQLADYAAKLDELERELAQEVIILEESIRTAEDDISQLNDAQRIIMRLRYIDGLEWKQIAKRTMYSEQHLYYLHKSALKAIEGSIHLNI